MLDAQRILNSKNFSDLVKKYKSFTVPETGAGQSKPTIRRLRPERAQTRKQMR